MRFSSDQERQRRQRLGVVDEHDFLARHAQRTVDAPQDVFIARAPDRVAPCSALEDDGIGPHLDLTGVLILAGLAPMGAGTNLPGALITRQEKTVKGSYYGSVHPRRDFPLLVDLYQAGRLDLDQLITKQYTLRQINEAYADMLSGDIARGVIVM